MKSKTNLLRLVESALLLAVATVLSMVPILSLPYGGSITACSALPILLVAYRHGTPWGLFTGFAYSLLQLLLGLNNLSYFTTPLSVVAVIVLDYLLAFTVLGLGGLFRKAVPSQSCALLLGGLFTGCLRYVLHVISGCTVWAGLSVPTEAALLYSLAYNATYMLPEVLVTLLGVWYLSRALDVRETIPTRAPAVRTQSRPALVLGLLGKGALLIAALWDVVEIFDHLQDGETGDFIIKGLQDVNWLKMGIVTAVGMLLWSISELIRRRMNKTA